MRRPLIFLCAALACVHLTLTAQVAPFITFVHINDVYEIEPIEGGKFGGLARVATVLSKFRQTGRPVVATLGGDFLSPSAISSARVDGEPLAAKQMVAVLNMLGLDWATLGNHEFDVGEATFRARMAEAKFKVISSNVTDAAGQPLPGVMVSAIVPVKTPGRTIRIGVIGLTLDMNRQPWVKYALPIAAAKAAIAGFAGRTDAIVALTHLTMAGDAELAEAIPEIDLVLGGHEHENWLARRGDRLTPIVKADANARSVAVVNLRFQGTARPTATVSFENLDAHVLADKRVQTEVRTWMNRGFDAFRRDGFNPDEAIGQVREPLDGRSTTVRYRPSTLTDLILAAMSRETGAPLAILNGGSIRIDDVVQPGPVRQYDVMRIVPFGGKVASAALDGAVLARVLDAGVANSGSGGILHWRGISRQESMWIVDGKPLDPAARYTVAMPEFLLTGLESRMDFLTRATPGVHDVREFKDIRFVVMDEIRRR